MKDGKADVGFVVDPDVDRLAIVMENGEMFVEEYTLVAVADYVLSQTPGNTVSNLSRLTRTPRRDRETWLPIQCRSCGRGQRCHQDEGDLVQ